MYICSQCGKQHEENVAFCENCGASMAAEQVSAVAEAEVTPKKAPQYAEKESLWVSIPVFLSNAVQIFAGFWAMMAVALPYIHASIHSSYWSGYYASAYYEPHVTSSIFTMIFSILGLLTALASLVPALIKFKSTEIKTILGRVLALFVGLLQIIVSIALVSQL